MDACSLLPLWTPNVPHNAQGSCRFVVSPESLSAHARGMFGTDRFGPRFSDASSKLVSACQARACLPLGHDSGKDAQLSGRPALPTVAKGSAQPLSTLLCAVKVNEVPSSAPSDIFFKGALGICRAVRGDLSDDAGYCIPFVHRAVPVATRSGAPSLGTFLTCA